jgi:hypothetical protein
MIYRLFEVWQTGGSPDGPLVLTLQTGFGVFTKYGQMSIVAKQWLKGKGGYHCHWRRDREMTKPNDWEKRKKRGFELWREDGVYIPDGNILTFYTEDQFLELYNSHRDSDRPWEQLHPDFGFYTGHVQPKEHDRYEILYAKVE